MKIGDRAEATGPTTTQGGSRHWSLYLPFYYGWLIIGIAFVTMAIGVTARTAFSLLMPPLIDEFGWERGLAAGAFSFGFLVSAVLSPIVGWIMDIRGPRIVILTGALLLAAGLLLAAAIEQPWHLYATLGVLVGGGANMMSFTVHSQFLPNWFVRRRGLAIGIAFSGVGLGAIVLLPLLQSTIVAEGWRASCRAMALLVMFVAVPLNVVVRKKPEDIGLQPDGAQQIAGTHNLIPMNVVDPAWAAIEWTLPRAMCTSRFWCIVLSYFCALVAWYAVQVHQTKYLAEIGFTPLAAAWALGMVSMIGIPGQILLGGLSDRIGREWVWTAGCSGFAICYLALIGLEHSPSPALLYVMVISQGFLGYALTSVMGPIVAEIFEGPHYGSIFGAITVALLAGGAAGPWIAGLIHDETGSYSLAFMLAIACCVISTAAIWMAAPGKVRLVPGRLRPQ
jgi:MFS family permease